MSEAATPDAAMADEAAVRGSGDTADVGSKGALAAATLAGLEGIGPGLLARWCGTPGADDALARLVDEPRPTCDQVDPTRWRSWQTQLGPALPAALQRTEAALSAADACALLPGERGYPRSLAEDARSPGVLIRRGRATGPEMGEPVVAIIGTRRASRIGREVAHELAAELAGRGVTVVSGLARGIDAAAHRGALSVEPGRTIGVIGCGPDQVYPREHRRLWMDVASGGGLMGEWPPGVPPNAWRFPARNRLLAALADVVVVVESARAGGSMHTVREAIERSVPVLAVPGSVRAGVSAGTNLLISEGCDPCLDVLDVLAALSRQGACCTPGDSGGRPAPGLQVPSGASASTGTSLPLAAAAVRSDATGPVGRQLKLIGPDGAAPHSAVATARPGIPKPNSEVHAHLEPDSDLDPDEAALLDVAGWGRFSLEFLVESSCLDVVSVSAAVGRLCERGALVEHGGWFERTGREP